MGVRLDPGLQKQHRELRRDVVARSCQLGYFEQPQRLNQRLSENLGPDHAKFAGSICRPPRPVDRPILRQTITKD